MRQTVYIPVEHAERGGDKDSVMNFQVGCTLRTGMRDVFFTHRFSTLLNFARNGEQRFQSGTNGRVLIVSADGIDQIIVAVQMVRGGGAMAGLAKVAVVSRGNEGGDHFPFTAGEGVWSA